MLDRIGRVQGTDSEVRNVEVNETNKFHFDPSVLAGAPFGYNSPVTNLSILFSFILCYATTYLISLGYLERYDAVSPTHPSSNSSLQTCCSPSIDLATHPSMNGMSFHSDLTLYHHGRRCGMKVPFSPKDRECWHSLRKAHREALDTQSSSLTFTNTLCISPFTNPQQP